MRAANSESCVTTTRLVPCRRLSSRIRSNTVSAVWRSRLQYARRLRHQGTGDRHALALAARQLAGPVIKPARQPHTGQRFGRLRKRRLARRPAHEQRHRHILDGGEFLQQVVKLVDEAECGVAQFAACRFGQSERVSTEQFDAARGRRIESPQQMQQRALARAGCTDDGKRLSRPHSQIDAAQHRDGIPSLLEHLAQTGTAQHGFTGREGIRLTHSAGPPPAGCATRASSDRASPRN